MKTLLQLNVTANWGSTGKIAEQIGLAAQAAGWDSYIAYGRSMNPSKNKLIKVGSKIGVYEHYVENKLLDNEGLASRFSTRRFLKVINHIKPDVVHLHNIHDHWLNFPLLFEYLSQKRIPVVWTQHDQWATTGHCLLVPFGCEKWKTECYKCPQSKWHSLDCSRRNYRMKKNLMAELPSLTIVPVSEWLGAEIAQSHLKNRPIEVIHNGIDLNVFRPQQVNAHFIEKFRNKKQNFGDKILVLGVSSVWNKSKGLMDFIKLSHDERMQVILIGVPADIRKELPENIISFGRTQNQLELAMFYTIADVFVNPTYGDMFPTVNLEALACGTPVVTYNTGGSPEALSSETGTVVEQGNINALINAITAIPAKRTTQDKNMSLACRERAERLFDKNKCFEKYIEIYNKAID